MDKRQHEKKERKVNVDEIELAIYSKIDALQAEITERYTTIHGLLKTLPCKYIITRTFIKDWECHRAKCSAGHKMYYSGNSINRFVYDKKNCHHFKSLKDANFYLECCKEKEILKDYVEIKIERVAK